VALNIEKSFCSLSCGDWDLPVLAWIGQWRWQFEGPKTKDSSDELASGSRQLANSKTLSLRSSILPFYSFVSFFLLFFYFFRATTTLDWNRKCWHRRQHLQIQFKFEPFRHASFTWHACKFCAKHIKHGQTAIKNKSK